MVTSRTIILWTKVNERYKTISFGYVLKRKETSFHFVMTECWTHSGVVGSSVASQLCSVVPGLLLSSGFDVEFPVFSLCLCGLILGSPVSSHLSKTCQ